MDNHIKLKDLLPNINEQMLRFDVLLEDSLNDFIGNDRLLSESTFPIQDDVKFVWKNYMVKVLNQYKSSPRKFANGDIVIFEFNSDILPSDTAKVATKQNICDFKCGIFSKGNRYKQKSNTDNACVYLTLHPVAIKYLGELGLKNTNILEKYPDIKYEFNEYRLIGAIAHEMTHWLDDTFYNFKNADNTNYLVKNNILPLDYYRTYAQHELDAYIHTIQNIKSNMDEDEYNNLTFADLKNLTPALKICFDKINSLPPKMIKDFSRRLFVRMSREDLLGKNMR